MAEPFTHTVATSTVHTVRGRARVDFRCSAGDLDGYVEAAPPEVADSIVAAITDGHAGARRNEGGTNGPA